MSHAVQGHPRWMGHSEEFWWHVVHWRKKWQPTPVFLPEEPHGQFEKVKRYDAGRWGSPPPGWKVSNVLLGKSRGQLLIAPERIKWLGQSGNDTQLWMCLVVKVKSDAVKNNTLKRVTLRTSLVVQWLRLHLSMQGLWVWIPDVWARIPHALGPKTKN